MACGSFCVGRGALVRGGGGEEHAVSVQDAGNAQGYEHPGYDGALEELQKTEAGVESEGVQPGAADAEHGEG